MKAQPLVAGGLAVLAAVLLFGVILSALASPPSQPLAQVDPSPTPTEEPRPAPTPERRPFAIPAIRNDGDGGLVIEYGDGESIVLSGETLRTLPRSSIEALLQAEAAAAGFYFCVTGAGTHTGIVLSRRELDCDRVRVDSVDADIVGE